MRVDVLAVLILVLAIAAAAAFYSLLRSPAPEDIAREWADSNLGGAAGSHLVAFYLAEINQTGDESFGESIKHSLNPITTWSYGPTTNLGGERYEVTTVAVVRLHEIFKPALLESIPISGSIDLSDYEETVTMPFHLTVDTASSRVIDWHAHADEAVYYTSIPRIQIIEEGTVTAPEECSNPVMERSARTRMSNFPYDAFDKPPEERGRIEAIQLNAAIIALGLDDVCEEWLGEIPEE